MKLTIQNKVGTLKNTATLKQYRADFSDLNIAVAYAFAKTKKLGHRLVVIEGNSYMNKVYHIAKESDDVVSYNGGIRQATKVVVVEMNGDVFYAEAI